MSEEDILRIQISLNNDMNNFNNDMKHQIVEGGDIKHGHMPPPRGRLGPNGLRGMTNFIGMMGKKGGSDGDGGGESSDGTKSKSEGGDKKEGGKDKNAGKKGGGFLGPGKKGLFGFSGKSGTKKDNG